MFFRKYYEAYSDLEHFEKSYPNYTGLSSVLSAQAIVLNKIGNLNRAANVIQEMKSKANNNPAGSPSYYIAAVYSVMGDKNQSLYWLEKAYIHYEVEMYWLNVEPLFISLYNDSRFKELLIKIGFK